MHIIMLVTYYLQDASIFDKFKNKEVHLHLLRLERGDKRKTFEHVGAF